AMAVEGITVATPEDARLIIGDPTTAPAPAATGDARDPRAWYASLRAMWNYAAGMVDRLLERTMAERMLATHQRPRRALFSFFHRWYSIIVVFFVTGTLAATSHRLAPEWT